MKTFTCGTALRTARALLPMLLVSALAADARELNGPTESRGIESVETAGLIELGGAFPGMAGHKLRARYITLAPGAVVAQHSHAARPAYAYILSGRVTEHRSTDPAPVEFKSGELAIEHGGLTHWLENTSGAPVRALVIDILAPQGE